MNHNQQQPSCRYPCTCAAPPVVDLTSAFFETYHHQHECRQQQQEDNHQHQQLLENLKSCGWSHVRLDLSSIMMSIAEQQSATASTSTSTENHSYPSILLQSQSGPNDWKKLLVQLFEQQQQQQQRQNSTTIVNSSTGTQGTGTIVYRVAESGSPDAGMVEPKQSFEVQRCTCCRRRHHHHYCRHDQESNQDELNVVPEQLLLQAWTELFHQVACTVRHVLKLPKNILLQEEPCHDCTTGTNTACHEMEQPDDDDRPSCSVDLLRAFYYETAATAASFASVVDEGSSPTTIATTTATDSPCCGSSSSDQRAFGSNEHTDWGSFTIVWQDDVEDCLQTYCHACDAWNNVQVTKSLKIYQQAENDQGFIYQNQNTLYLVVHVGDVTSLAIGKQHEQPTTATSPTNTATPTASRSQSNERADGNHLLNNSNKAHHEGLANFDALADDATSVKTVIWPSPRHRVCLPTAKQQRRASLVYFAYPPPELSINSISQALREWYAHTTTIPTTLKCGHDGSGGGNDTTQQTSVAQSTLPQTAAVAAAPAATSHHWVPYQDYYLLKNQATAAQVDDLNNKAVNAAQCQFEKIASMPLRTVLTEKWNQVQRGF
jgi:hypothetical protein